MAFQINRTAYNLSHKHFPITSFMPHLLLSVEIGRQHIFKERIENSGTFITNSIQYKIKKLVTRHFFDVGFFQLFSNHSDWFC